MENKLYLTIQIISIICIIAGTTTLTINAIQFNRGCDSCNLYWELENVSEEMIELNKYGLGGYATQNYYCVWTKDRSEVEKINTEIHEQGHILVQNDYPHFCSDIAKEVYYGRD